MLERIGPMTMRPSETHANIPAVGIRTSVGSGTVAT